MCAKDSDYPAALNVTPDEVSLHVNSRCLNCRTKLRNCVTIFMNGSPYKTVPGSTGTSILTSISSLHISPKDVLIEAIIKVASICPVATRIQTSGFARYDSISSRKSTISHPRTRLSVRRILYKEKSCVSKKTTKPE